MCLESGLRFDLNWPWIGKLTITSKFSDMTSLSNVFGIAVFSLSILVTGKSFRLMSLQLLKFRQFCSMKDWPEIQISENSPSKFCPISGDWELSTILNLAEMLLMKCYEILHNARVTACTVYELLREKQLVRWWKERGEGDLPPPKPD